MPVLSHGCESTSNWNVEPNVIAYAGKFLQQAGLVVYCGLQLTPLFVQFAGVHQWDIMQKDLVEWVQVRRKKVDGAGGADSRWGAVGKRH